MKEQEGILYLFALLHLSVNLSSDTVQTLPTYVYNISINQRHGAENILRPCFFKEIDLPLYFKQPKR